MTAIALRLRDASPAHPVATPDRRHVASLAMLATALLLYLLAGVSLLGGSEGRADARAAANLAAKVKAEAAAAPPAPEPLRFQPVAPTDAVAINAAVPVAAVPNPAASAFALRSRTMQDRGRAVDCLTSAIYYEAASESPDGQRAVAQVVLNRVRHPAYPNSVCGVVFQGSERATGCQFSYTCDGSLRRTPSVAGWARARGIAEAALAGVVFAPVGHATHYHTNWVVPYWSSSLVKVANIGAHIFYRWSGSWGRPAAFGDAHAGLEPDVSNRGRRTAAEPVLAGGEPGLTDVLATEAAKSAATDSASVESFERAVLRRYVPADRSGVATVLAAQTPKGEAVPTAHRWALTGEGPASDQPALGKPAKAEDKLAPSCLEGVKKAPVGGAAAAAGEALAC